MVDIRDHGGNFGGSGGFVKGDIIPPESLKILTGKTIGQRLKNRIGTGREVQSLAVGANGDFANAIFERIQKVSKDGNVLWTTTGAFNYPKALAIDSLGNVFAGGGETKLFKLNATTGVSTTVTSFPVRYAVAIAIDSADNIIIHAEKEIIKINKDLQLAWRTPFSSPLSAGTYSGKALAIDSNNNIYAYVAEGDALDPHRLVKISPTGQILWKFNIQTPTNATTEKAVNFLNVHNEKVYATFDKKINVYSAAGALLASKQTDTLTLSGNSVGMVMNIDADNAGNLVAMTTKGVLLVMDQSLAVLEMIKSPIATNDAVSGSPLFGKSLTLATPKKGDVTIVADWTGSTTNDGMVYNLETLYQVTGYEVIKRK